MNAIEVYPLIRLASDVMETEEKQEKHLSQVGWWPSWLSLGTISKKICDE